MNIYTKEKFLWLVRVRPKLLMGREIIYQKKPAKILDIAVTGDYFLLEYGPSRRSWEPVDAVDECVATEGIQFPADAGKPFTVATITESMSRMESLVGTPGGEHPKPLFETVETLNKDLIELRLNDLMDIKSKIKELESLYRELPKKRGRKKRENHEQ